MKLLSSTDYAIRLLMLLAQENSQEHRSVEEIAERLGGLSRHHLHKIVQGLAGMGLLHTSRGAKGGVRLARAPAEIRIGPLIRALESGVPIVECFRDGDMSCTLLPACRLRGMLSRASEAYYAVLDQSTLADCIAPARQLLG